ncbi:hypothetical protein BKA70DRAFT_1231006 [Coprinopsis sp. MPI-PUGE-AT-0042]|nr:hypothetical protein BKA70DRAFT_1231006 [Coprinopsis sp. MPI-PUGE-AT-0042]
MSFFFDPALFLDVLRLFDGAVYLEKEAYNVWKSWSLAPTGLGRLFGIGIGRALKERQLLPGHLFHCTELITFRGSRHVLRDEESRAKKKVTAEKSVKRKEGESNERRANTNLEYRYGPTLERSNVLVILTNVTLTAVRNDVSVASKLELEGSTDEVAVEEDLATSLMRRQGGMSADAMYATRVPGQVDSDDRGTNVEGYVMDKTMGECDVHSRDSCRGREHTHKEINVYALCK